MIKVEQRVSDIESRHGLSTVHIFDTPTCWRAFGFRRDAKGFLFVVEDGIGDVIGDALDDLDARLREGPIHKPRIEP